MRADVGTWQSVRAMVNTRTAAMFANWRGPIEICAVKRCEPFGLYTVETARLVHDLSPTSLLPDAWPTNGRRDTGAAVGKPRVWEWAPGKLARLSSGQATARRLTAVHANPNGARRHLSAQVLAYEAARADAYAG